MIVLAYGFILIMQQFYLQKFLVNNNGSHNLDPK